LHKFANANIKIRLYKYVIRNEGSKMFNLFKSPQVVTHSAQDAYERFRRGEIYLVDVREANEWAQMRIPGALHAPLTRLADHLPGLPADKPVVFYCLSGMRSARAVALCQSLGKPHKSHVSGGMSAWRAAKLPIES
jgi:rhodanese-related sulfurtransferase